MALHDVTLVASSVALGTRSSPKNQRPLRILGSTRNRRRVPCITNDSHLNVIVEGEFPVETER